MIKIAPSILGADFAKMGEQIRLAERAGADWLHVDVMDGHFVPNLTLGPDAVKAVDRTSDLFLDVHLMVTNPENFFEPFRRAGADLLTFHIEVAPDPHERIEMIRNLGCRVGLSLNPDRSVEAVMPFLHLVDLVLVMSVYPGYGGQVFMTEALERLARIREYRDSRGLACEIEVDGGINRKNARQVIEAGADILVMGSAFFGCDDPAELVREIKAGA